MSATPKTATTLTVGIQPLAKPDRDLLAAPNAATCILAGVPRVYEQDGAVWLELTGGDAAAPPQVYHVTVLNFHDGLALLTLDYGAVVIMQLDDLAGLRASNAVAAVIKIGGVL